jgi:hypothetical protein
VSDGAERGTSERPSEPSGTVSDGAERGTGEQPLLRVVTGDPSPEELAALVAVLASLGGTDAPPPRRTPVWNAPRRLVRATHRHGPGAWRASSLPR